MKRHGWLVFFAVVCVAFFLSFNFNCQAAEGNKAEVLKKIEGTYNVTRTSLEGKKTLECELEFKLGDNYLTITEKVVGSPPVLDKIVLEEISISDGYLSVGHRFHRDVPSSTIKIAFGGEISGETVSFGRMGTIKFIKK